MDFSTIMSVGKGVISLGKQSPFKLVIILAIISALAGFFVWYHNEVKQSGVAQCELEHAAESDKADSNKVSKLNKQLLDLQDMNRKTDADLRKARKTIKQYQVTRRDIDEEITRLSTEVDSCRVLGPKFLRLFNGSIGSQPII